MSDNGDATQAQKTEATSPPYVPFKTLLNLVQKMEDEGIPNQIDKSFLGHLSGGTQSHLWASMRSLGLIDEKRAPTPVLRSLVAAADNRPAHMREILGSKLFFAVKLGTTATHQELVDAFTSNSPNLSAPTRDKAVSFYLAAATYAGIPLSKWFKSKPGAGATSSARRAPRKKVVAGRPTNEKSPANGDTVTEDSLSSMRARYFKALLAKVEDAGAETDTDLLDRIERLLNTEDQKPK